MRLNTDKLQEEIEEKSKDLAAFVAARELVRRRVLEVRDSCSQLTPLPNWSGTDAVLGSLDLAIHAMQRTLEELKSMEAEPLPASNNFRLIRGDKDDEN